MGEGEGEGEGGGLGVRVEGWGIHLYPISYRPAELRGGG